MARWHRAIAERPACKTSELVELLRALELREPPVVTVGEAEPLALRHWLQ